ncbi:DAK2 domain-containing protein [Candidatus Mycoplasma mahonii]|uniref:DAK2 domain-containing protein n=1 Tax=Candidatus Mycoplasma mahonii TaxID=3004105 RepID=UPI0026EEE68C|nr:DAK2 domain-containing protein [Candidatus Mycoplasma mahonii]WKX02724.1 DAK2 domain-containing protein [Candidatus Mycoplasma mahonii]
MKTINGTKWKELLESGVNAISNNIDRIDALNVFPVPDGDTGSNMGATALSAFKDITKINSDEISVVSAKFARGMLLGARGNSGVIVSQIFKGLSIGFEDKSTVNAFDIVEAFKQAKIYGYKSVMKPVEGTMLTVIRLISEDLEKTITPAMTIEEIFEEVVKSARTACDLTPSLLPVLKEVGVTDSGGEGLFLILEGILLALKGKHVKLLAVQAGTDNISFIKLENDNHEGLFGYCTEYILQLDAPKQFKIGKYSENLTKMGDSIATVHDDDILKVHLHTLNPGKVFTFAQKYGEFVKLKSENMTLQANESAGKKQANARINKNNTDEKVNIAIISCNIGSGIINDMRDLGVDFIIEGGQTVNPSAAVFIDAIKKLNTNKIIILPNNSNIILAAQQVAQTIKDKEIIIVPSKTQLEGLVAIMNFDRDSTLDGNKEEMLEAISTMKTGQVAKASRTTRIEGVSIKEGEYLAIAEKKILKSTNSSVKSAIAISKKLIDDDTEVVTIYYGDESSAIDAEELSSYLETHFDVEVEVKDGAQPFYHFLIGYE